MTFTLFGPIFLILFLVVMILVYTKMVMAMVKKIINAPNFVERKTKMLYYGLGIGSLISFLAFIGCILDVIIRFMQGDNYFSAGAVFLGFVFFGVSALLGALLNRMTRG